MLLLKLCSALNEKKIAYVIVGGYAVALHGAVRGTVDLDLVLTLKKDAYIHAEKIFMSLGLQSRLPVTAEDIFNFREEYIKKRSLIAWSFFDPANPGNQLDVVITENASKMTVKTITVQSVKIKIASIKSLIEMKSRSGRPQDLEDIKALKELAKNEK